MGHANTSNKPSLLKVIPNKRVVHISQSSLDYTFHGLDQKRLVLSVYVLNPLKQKWREQTYNYPKLQTRRNYMSFIQVSSIPLIHEPCYEQYSKDLDFHKDHPFAYQHQLVLKETGQAVTSCCFEHIKIIED